MDLYELIKNNVQNQRITKYNNIDNFGNHYKLNDRYVSNEEVLTTTYNTKRSFIISGLYEETYIIHILLSDKNKDNNVYFIRYVIGTCKNKALTKRKCYYIKGMYKEGKVVDYDFLITKEEIQKMKNDVNNKNIEIFDKSSETAKEEIIKKIYNRELILRR